MKVHSEGWHLVTVLHKHHLYLVPKQFNHPLGALALHIPSQRQSPVCSQSRYVSCLWVRACELLCLAFALVSRSQGVSVLWHVSSHLFSFGRMNNKNGLLMYY